MRWVCLVPSEPVMPWTMTLESLLRKIDTAQAPCAASSAARRAASSMVSTSSTRSCSASCRMRRPSSALLPSRRTTSGLSIVSPRPEHLERGDDAVGDRVARGDAAEDVDEHAADLRVAQDDLEAVGHDLCGGAAADVEEVGRLHAAELLAGVGDDVERGHDEARAVADDADLAVELDVVEVLLLGGASSGSAASLSSRPRGRGDGRPRSRRGSPCRRGRGPRRRGAHQRVDLDERGVLVDEDVPELLTARRRWRRPPPVARTRRSSPARRSRGPWPRRRRRARRR